MRLGEGDFRTYVAAFNTGDFDTVGRYYDDAIVLENAAGVRMVGRDAIFAFYRKVRQDTRRILTVRRVFTHPDGLAAELQSEFVALRDAPDVASGPLRTGDRILVETVAVYDLTPDGARFARIRSGRLARTFIPAA